MLKFNKSFVSEDGEKWRIPLLLDVRIAKSYNYRILRHISPAFHQYFESLQRAPVDTTLDVTAALVPRGDWVKK